MEKSLRYWFTLILFLLCRRDNKLFSYFILFHFILKNFMGNNDVFYTHLPHLHYLFFYFVLITLCFFHDTSFFSWFISFDVLFQFQLPLTFSSFSFLLSYSCSLPLLSYSCSLPPLYLLFSSSSLLFLFSSSSLPLLYSFLVQ